jgi:putative membrane protein
MTQPDWAAAPTAAPLGAQPSPRGNPITRAQALNRIYTRGYSDISDLWLDQSGIWRGHAIKDGRKVTVWLDHMGNVGQRR